MRYSKGFHILAVSCSIWAGAAYQTEAFAAPADSPYLICIKTLIFLDPKFGNSDYARCYCELRWAGGMPEDIASNICRDTYGSGVDSSEQASD